MSVLYIVVVLAIVLVTKRVAGSRSKSEVLNEAELETLYAQLETVHAIFSEFEVPYWLTGGSLLGAVRHGEHIPWDDDADICVPHEFEGRMLSKEFGDALSKHGLVFDNSGFVSKIYSKTGNKGNEYPFPWVDVFFVSQDSDGNWSFHKPEHIRKWPKCHSAIPNEAIFPTIQCTFGGLRLQCPQDSHRELSRCYGENYMTEFEKYTPHDKGR